MEGLTLLGKSDGGCFVVCFKLHERNLRLNPFCIRHDVFRTHGRWLRLRQIMLVSAGGLNS